MNVRAVAAFAAGFALIAAPADAKKPPKPKPGTFEFTYKGTTSQGSAIKIVTHVDFFKDGKQVLQGSASAKASTHVEVVCDAYEDQPAGTKRSYNMKGSALRYTGSPEAFDMEGDLSGGILPNGERAVGNITGRAKLKNYLPTSSSKIKGTIEVASRPPTQFNNPTTAMCVSGKVPYKAKFASKRRVSG